MPKAAKKIEAVLPRVRWSDEEAKAMALQFVPLRFAQTHLTMPELCEEAQRICIELGHISEDRRRSFLDSSSAYTISTRLTNFWNTFAKLNPEAAHRLINEAKVPPDKKEQPVQLVPMPTTAAEPAAEPVAEAAVEKPPMSLVDPYLRQQQGEAIITTPAARVPETPHAPAPAPATPFLGPLEMALQAMVQRANEGNLMTIITHIDMKFDAMYENLQSLANAHHDSLMGYFDPDFKRLREIAAEFVTDGIDSPRAKLDTVRVKKKQVLVVCTNNVVGIQRTLEPKFNGIDFKFVDGGASKLQIAGFYDLVLCNGTNRPAVREKLNLLHGQKVCYTDGGSTSMIEHIRKRFGI